VGKNGGRAGFEEFESERYELNSKIGVLTVKLDFAVKKIQTAWPVNRAKLVEKNHPKLSERERCNILGLECSVLNYKPVEESQEDRKIMRTLDEIYTKDPCQGSRQLAVTLERYYTINANGKRIQRLRRSMGIETIWCRSRRTSMPDNGHLKYPYFLGDRVMEYVDEVWCADITYIPMPQGMLTCAP
jgi:putative transposase